MGFHNSEDRPSGSCRTGRESLYQSPRSQVPAQECLPWDWPHVPAGSPATLPLSTGPVPTHVLSSRLCNCLLSQYALPGLCPGLAPSQLALFLEAGGPDLAFKACHTRPHPGLSLTPLWLLGPSLAAPVTWTCPLRQNGFLPSIYLDSSKSQAWESSPLPRKQLLPYREVTCASLCLWYLITWACRWGSVCL